ncbi:hypothetical protein [uncultured Jatrophihabitans sp.]|uniref:hypothetical protein n=1 Tax=uncultured Jatrophihabitans sp. TaxID=1610747 RepID=UPI0035C9ECED
MINVGAGAGSYEPVDREVVAVEPSAAMATVTIHQWTDTVQGLRELRRVARGPVVVLTFDGDALDRFWLADYVPELIAAERRRYPPIARIGEVLGGVCDVLEVQIPIECVDGFTGVRARPHDALGPERRRR